MYSFINDDPSSSAGCGGVGPAGSRNRLGNFGTCVIVFSILLVPVSSVLSPTFGLMLKTLCTDGRRRSASISSTRAPFCASTTAVLMLVVVFPSCGNALVISRTFGGAPVADNRMEVRSARYDSEISDFGRR